jgi:hypothetical protein
MSKKVSLSKNSKDSKDSKDSKNSKDSKDSKNLNKLNNNNKSKLEGSKSTGGVNLTPLISALLLAGIKLSLEQNKKTKKVASNSKSTKTKPRRRTI